MNILIANHFLRQFTGSEIAAIDLAKFFHRKKWDVTLTSFICHDPLKKEVEKLGLNYINLRDITTKKYFDFVWMHHFTTAEEILSNGFIDANYFIFSSLSPFEKLELPPLQLEKVNIILANSNETKKNLNHLGIDNNSIFVFPNPVLNDFFCKKAILNEEIKKVTVVSNHIPKELNDAIKILEKKIDVEVFGFQGKEKLVEPEDLLGSDAVITIGRTVQYSLALGIPVYCYDRFGGPGWISPENIEKSSWFNFSGRCCNRKIAAEDIVHEIFSNYKNIKFHADEMIDYAYKNFSLEKKIEELFADLSGKKNVSFSSKSKEEILKRRVNKAVEELPLFHYTTYLTRHHSPFHPDDPLPADSPVVTFVVPCSRAELPLLADTLDSLGVQSAPLWRLVVLADAPAPDAMWDELPMLRWRALASLEEMGEALGEELEAVASGWVSVFAPGVRLAADAVEQLVRHALAFPQWRLMYGDSDTVDADGARRDPLFRPDLNLDLLRSMPYLGPCLWVEREAFAAVGGLGEQGGAWRYDLALRVLDAFGDEAIGHVDEVLYSLPAGRDEAVDEAAHHQALAAHLARRGLEAEVAEGYVPGTWRVVYRWPRQPRVSIIIPTKDQADYLQACVESVRAKTAYPDYEILVVDNGSTQPEALAYLERLKAEGVRVLPYPKPFNFSAMCNLAAREASGEYLLLLNNDTAVLQEHWLERMVAYGQRPDVGIVGVKLMFPQPQTVQHVGVILGLGGIAEHPYLGLLGLTDGGYMNRALVDQDLSAVTAACLLIRKSVWEEVKGLDEQAFRVSYNDVDLCLKVRERGYKILWTPFVVLVHHGSVSQQQEAAEPAKARKAQQRFGKEQEAMLRKWLPQLARDPAYNRHLSLTHRDYRVEPEIVVNWDPRLPSEKVRVLGWEQLSGVIEYRIKQPLEGLWQARAAERSFIHAPGVRQTRIPLLVEVERAKPDVFTASAFLELSDHLETVRQVQEVARIPFLLHLDDLISEIPRQSEVYEHRNTPGEMKRVVRTADRVVVTTEPIRAAIEKYAREVRLIPNYLPGWVWNGLKSERRVGPKPRVGWAGAMQHAGDLALIREVVEATSEECDWVFFGMCPEELRPFVKEFHSFVPFEEYPAKLASLNLDLAVAPLEVNRFNECKSNLRLLEYGILGWPVVCSDVLPYRGAPVTRVPNRPEAWLEAIRARIHDLDEAQKEGEALQRWVREGWMLEDHLGEWIEAYRFGG